MTTPTFPILGSQLKALLTLPSAERVSGFIMDVKGETCRDYLSSSLIFESPCHGSVSVYNAVGDAVIEEQMFKGQTKSLSDNFCQDFLFLVVSLA